MKIKALVSYGLMLSIFIGISFFACNRDASLSILTQENKDLKAKFKESVSREHQALKQVDSLKSKFKELGSQEVLVKVIRDTIRIQQNNIIQKARSFSEEMASNVLNERFPTQKENLIFVLEADSLKFEYHSLTELYEIEREKTMLHSLALKKYEDIIIPEKEFQISTLKTSLIAEKRKRKKYILGGVGIGFSAAVVTYVLLK